MGADSMLLVDIPLLGVFGGADAWPPPDLRLPGMVTVARLSQVWHFPTRLEAKISSRKKAEKCVSQVKLNANAFGCA